ncbi:hypothetical protein A2697_05700 [Candidatus Curtissbacteria bacterium RIFCSPHIGHO2_01_FULL_41_44]|uniref:DUF2292 domain-containing protein n=1 Tax=Candidatus Curtissbacteria bacterium RIFCSPLOWO2_01_FULL_42_50 TaxID=1797730 RepID=A0A1F5H5Z4_9BACT|nr:MAG: hypothetical protein A3C33_04725 [Candidatus Curtissbacteria bacterium RIFCSPHIGHO2_02_FULL_42_58]OGD94444.1 MAG: hypothetical protein A2697_05700 [Candidatus Curtissbacteria bacterium RIFCSPHIGHO2_01_FULL_41_44]OGD97632.1 MAG: hypothetical protein A3E71_00155 [Candidatus Curtissbacteria bacterium RIFCSPHIGHO2_12_FULL_42_33]OGD99511.1 MAG: hypothetical protein A3B54_03400 [Candidatus Curtissbacteria bacterium RIFCSPLOWO2_01_FULL_42_50]OGE03802.1 MAG: hypothetical protein A3G16_05000 [Ca
MNQTDNEFSTVKITPQLLAQVIDALKNKAYGSVEIYIQNYRVVQITERTITKVQTARSFKKIITGQNDNSVNKVHSRQVESQL